MENLVLSDIRRNKHLRQQDIADYLGMAQSTYAYREANGGFTEDEKKKIAKYLKVDMTTITWKPSFDVKATDSRDQKIREQAELIIKLEEKVKTLQEMIDKLLQNR